MLPLWVRAPSSHEHLDPAEASGVLSAEARQGQILNLATSPQAREPQPWLEAGHYVFWDPVQAFPPKWPGPTLGARRSSSATRHSYKEQRDGKKLQAIVYSHYSLPSMLGTYPSVWKSLKKKKKFWMNHIWLMIDDKEQSKTAVSLLVMISTHF